MGDIDKDLMTLRYHNMVSQLLTIHRHVTNMDEIKDHERIAKQIANERFDS